MSSIPILQPRVVLGLRVNVRGNALYMSDEEIIYPVGGLLAIHNYNQRKQKFIKLNNMGKLITSICLSPNKKLMAVAESGEKPGDRPNITLYDPWTAKKKRMVNIPADREMTAREFVTMAFACDSKTIIAVAGEPEWVMYVFRSDKGKLDSTTRATNSNGTGIVVQVASNPNDNNLLVLVGNQLFRMLGYAEGLWRQFGFNKADQMNISTAAWVSQDRLLAGTVDGKILFVESGELKSIWWAGDLPVINMKLKEELGPTSSQTNIDIEGGGNIDDGVDYQIKWLLTFNKGFAFGFTTGNIMLYEKETQHKYKKRNVFKIPLQTVERESQELDAEAEVTVLNELNTISVNVSEDKLIATCNANQIYVTRLWGADMTVSPEIIMLELGLSLHYGTITGMAVCAWKPILMTAGGWDRTLRVWNYETDNLELCRSYLEDMHSLAMHPSGLFAVVGFSDKLRFLTILIDDFSSTREFPIRNCKLCTFSKLGHLFAAVNGNVIQVYSAISFEHMFNLKGHNGIVTGMSWMHDDYKLASCGTEGAVYEWQISTTRRICETIIKSCQFSDVAMTNDGKSTYAIGSDGRLRELMTSNVHRDVVISAGALMDGLALSNSDMMLFCTGACGVIYSIKLPILDFAEYNEYLVHATKVNKILISYDDKYLFSASDIGTLVFWKIGNTEGKAVKMDKEFQPSTEILISKTDLEEKMATIKDLQVRMHELQTEHAYQMRQTEAAHNQTVKEVHEGYCEAIEELKEKIETLETEHTQDINNINTDIGKMKDGHEMFVQKLEANYNEKLIFEYNKYQNLEEKMGKMRQRYDKELEDLGKAKKDSETTITNNFLQMLHEKEVQLEEILEEAKQRTKEHEIIKQQIEDDADREIYELKSVHQKELREEQDLNVKLRSETQLIKKKLMASQKEIDDLKHTVNNQENEQFKLKGVIVGLEKDIADLKKEIAERDSTIQDKEKRIAELKRKNQELEKFKFILDFKIEELKSQIEPRDRTIQEQTEQITDMVNELENLQKVIMSLELQLNELRGKLKGADNEIKREIAKNRAVKAALKTIRSDIHHASGLIQDIPNLQRAVRSMYHKYNADKDFVIAQAEDQEAKNEFLRQRDFLERTVNSLKTQVSKKHSTGGVDKIRLIQENSYLLTETNVLRKDLKTEQRTNKKMLAVLGLAKTGMTARESEKKLSDAVAARDDIAKEFEEIINREEKVLNALKSENDRLLTKIVVKEEVPVEYIKRESSFDNPSSTQRMKHRSRTGSLTPNVSEP